MQIPKIQQKCNPNFHAGLTKQLKSEVLSCDINKIVREFEKNNIVADFKNNKMLAWCSIKTFEIIKTLRKNFRLNLSLPNGIVVEDFNKLRIDNPEADAFCNSVPTHLYFDKDVVVPHNTVFFNECKELNSGQGNEYWNQIDEIADWEYEMGESPTNSFLYTFLHEFSHVIHNSNIIDLYGGENYINIVLKALDNDFLKSFQDKYGKIALQLCNYAAYSPFEGVACDLGKRLSQDLDEKTLIPTKNSLKGSPYLKRTINPNDSEYNQLMTRLFNGDFE